MGVQTFVIDGLFMPFTYPHPVPDFAKVSRDIAAAGGTEAPYTPTDVPQLDRALREITGGLVSCDVTLNGKVTAGSECSGSVEVDGVRLPCNQNDGWRLKDATTVEITGKACEDLKLKPEAQIKADFPCDVFDLL
jgi:hypothetical protein